MKTQKNIWALRNIPAFLYAFCALFLVPLYMKNGFVMIGDAKYNCYFYGAMVIIGIAALFLIAGVAENAISMKIDFSYTELCALFFLLVTVLSVLLSKNKDVAIWGYQDWHVGGIVQATLVMGFFLMKRWMGNDRVIFGMAWVAAFLICLLTVFNRCGSDPLGTYQGMDFYEWNRRNLIATIGNINWACCYLAVSVPVLLYLSWIAKGNWRILGLVGAFTGIAAIQLQGSDAGFLDLAVMMAVLFWFSLRSWEKLLRFLEMLWMIPLLWCSLVLLRVELVLPADAKLTEKLYSWKWVFALVLIAGIYVALRLMTNKKGHKEGMSARWVKGIHAIMIAVLVILIVTFCLCQISEEFWKLLGSKAILRFDEEWGSLRGGLWKSSWSSFLRLDLSRKLFGVGPDCFAFLLEEMQVTLAAQGQWIGATYANAHNEFMTMLVNEGLMGVLTYFGIFVSILVKMIRGEKEQTKYVLGVLIVITYLANGFLTFQQVVSTPFVFCVIGMMDHLETGKKITEKVRRKK